MNRVIVQGGCVLLLPVLTLLGQVSDPPRHPREVEAQGLMVKRSEITGTDPAADLGVARYWVVEKGKDVWALLVEVRGVNAAGSENVRVARYRDAGVPSTVPAEIASAASRPIWSWRWN